MLNKTNKAFTLAEVLIALVVIGIIAAITVPGLITNYKKHAASTKIKKFYATMQQAITKAKADGNDLNDWADNPSSDDDNRGTITTNFCKKYILPYIFYQKTFFNGRNYYIYFNDGTYVIFDYTGGCMEMYFDTNGIKKPNIQGSDIFRFLYCSKLDNRYKQREFIPYKATWTTTRAYALYSCKSMPYSCSGLLSFDNWEFKDDYPYKVY
jgi:prepilin-type N-terminal cleavage/methylation domain-containing protein